MKKIIKHFIVGSVGGAIFMFFGKLVIGTQWDSDDIKSIIFFGFIGLLYFTYIENKK
tara:strand:+ start:532 stop:702 length:171 start_codon:yes stop_codon:yes gene_type:complete